ncbi:MAG: tape measure protein [Acidaminococcaceae bacterium]|nr:tape measure protein [Acidaminococcaceae bacterium]
MAKIENYISLADGVSPTLNKIIRLTSETTTGMRGAAGSINGLSNAAETATSRMSSFGKVLAESFVGAAALGAVVVIRRSLGDIAELSDHLVGTNARLQLVAGSQENVAALNGMIYESAQRARGAYVSMADTVAGLSINARDAFGNPAETVRFVEGLQKLFVIGGASAENQRMAMLQLQQALASGRLQGDEFRSITENAPILQDMIARTMGVSRGELKKLSTEGEITAQVIKDAVLKNGDEIDAQFEKMPKKWSDHMTNIQNSTIRAFQPILQQVSGLANSDAVRNIVNGIIGAVRTLVPVAYAVMSVFSAMVSAIGTAVGAVSGFIQNHGILVRGVIAGITTALAIMTARYVVSGARIVASLAATAFATLSKSAADVVETGTTIAATYAQWGLNAALYACPLSWIVAGVALIIGIFFAAVEAVNYFTDSNYSAVGIIAGCFAGLYATLRNILTVFLNFGIAIINLWVAAWDDPLVALANFFTTIWNGIVLLVAASVNKIIDLVNKIPGMNGRFGHVSAPTFSAIPTNARQLSYYGFADVDQAARWGYKKGASIGNFDFGKYKPDLSGLPNSTSGTLGNIANNTGKGAAEGKRAADALDASEDDLRYLREIAEREAVNRYTTASVRIDMGGVTNEVNNGMDLDGVVDSLTNGLYDGMVAAAKEVHV